MKSEIKLRIYALMITVIALAMIWMVGSGDAAQDVMQGYVYSNKVYAQSGDLQDNPDLSTDQKHSLAYYTKMMADIAYKIHTRYMEDVDPESLIEAGINGMLENLDPYSVLMKKRSYDALMESTQGKYEGVGMQIDLRDDRVTIIAPIEGTPAYRLGFRSGDKIMRIDSTSTDGMNTEEAANLMRGPAGTKVKLTIERPGVDYPLEYDVERAVIELKSVRYYGVVEPGIGYVRLDKFSEHSTEELSDAIKDMTTNMGVKSLIFDLRANGGGLLDQAISVANLFLPKDKLVVYTKGKYPTSEKKYFSRLEPIFPDGELAILVNGGTASASEIVSGAVQDWDRGVVIGSTTFGKGLVQQIFGGEGTDLTLKLTTAKYYIPSGRCIQKPEKSKKHGDEFAPEPTEISTDTKEIDTTREIYQTNAGREVYGGGGVIPDVPLEEEKWKPIEYNLLRKNMFFDFAIDYTTRHPGLPKDFAVTDAMVEDFRQYIKKRNFEYKTALEFDLEKFEETAKKLENLDKFQKDLADMKTLIEKEKVKDFDESHDYIRQSIKREILRKEYGEAGIYEQLTLKEDKVVLKALGILKDKKKYSTLLQSQKKAEG